MKLRMPLNNNMIVLRNIFKY